MFEVIVVGGGPAGVTAALGARELGATVALVERGELGGTCANDGCVPTRVLARTARLLRDAAQYADYGLVGAPPRAEMARVFGRVRRVVRRVHEHKRLRARLEAAGVRVFDRAGEARFVDPHTLALAGAGTTLEAERFILCAGGRARRLTCPGGEHALGHADLWALSALPATIAVVGAAATGCQLASLCAAFGARVRLLDHAPRLLAGEDALVSREVGAAFARRGIDVVAGITGVERIEPVAGGFRLRYARDGETRSLTVGAVVAAIGWVGNLEGLGLAAAGVATARGHVVTDDELRTTAPHIFAAGDLTGRLMLVQGATGEGTLAAENAVLGRGRILRHAVVPHGGFTDPEYAGVGPTEDEARRTADLAVATVPYADLDRAVIDGHTAGACKLLVCRATRRVLGAHIVGEQAVEVAQVAAAAVRAGLRVEQVADLELAYPTYTAIVGLAARRIARELGAVPRAPGRGPGEPVLDAEWEHAGRAGVYRVFVEGVP